MPLPGPAARPDPRVRHHPRFAIAEDVPADVTDAYQRLIAAGYNSRLLKE
jgi:hypothetical protein